MLEYTRIVQVQRLGCTDSVITKHCLHNEEGWNKNHTNSWKQNTGAQRCVRLFLHPLQHCLCGNMTMKMEFHFPCGHNALNLGAGNMEQDVASDQ